MFTKKLIYLFTMICFVSLVMISQNPYDKVFSNYRCVNNDRGVLSTQPEYSGNANSKTRSESDVINYSIAENPEAPMKAYSYNGIAAGRQIYLGFEFEGSEIKNFVGSKITYVNIATGSASGQNKVRDITVFLTKNLDEQPIYVQEAKLGDSSYTLYPIELSTPYEIVDASSLYIGYYFKYETDMGYFIPVDGIPTSKPGLLFAFNDGTSWPKGTQWNRDADEIGSLCMSVTIQGENLPRNTAKINKVNFPNSVKPGEEDLNYEVDIVNNGVNSINSVEVQTSFGGSVYNTVIETNEITSGNKVKIPVTGVPVTASGIFEVTSTISKVNGEVNDNAQKSATGILACYKDGYPRNMVLEEGTGTWCGYCPAGIVMFEYVHEKYNDRLIPIAVHNGDEMAIPEYQPLIYDYISGFPSVVANRTEKFHPAVLSKVDNLYKQALENPSYAQVELQYSLDGHSINISSETEFSVGTDVEHQLSFVVVEDGVGPYTQANYYGQGSGLGMWDTAGSQVSIKFDDVARHIDSYPGIANSLPSNIQAEKKYSFTRKMDISRVVSDNFRVIAMITNSRTGEIINAAQAKKVSESKITLDKETLTMSTGETAKLTANIISEDTGEKIVSWSTSNSDVVTVNDEGNVSAISEGTANVTASYGSLSASCLVTVVAKEIKPTGIVIDPSSAIIEKGKYLQLNYSVAPEDATYSQLFWSSSDETIATVDNSGLVSALNVGSATITVTISDNVEVSSSCEITVTDLSTVNSVCDDEVAVRSVNGALEISGIKGGSEIMVYDVSGSLILTTHSADTAKRVELSKGIYMIRVGSSIFKIVI